MDVASAIPPGPERTDTCRPAPHAYHLPDTGLLSLAPRSGESMAHVTGTRFWDIWIPRLIGALAVGLGVLLAAMIWFIHDAVEHASDVLVRGQAIELLNDTHHTLRRIARRPEPHDFDDLLANAHAQGLRYVALLGPDGRPEVEAGTPAGPIDRGQLVRQEPMDPQPIGTRFRMHNIPPHHGPPPHGETDRPPPPGEDGPDAAPFDPRRPPPPGPHGPPPLVIEFEPVQALAVRTLARRAVWGGVVTVPLFIISGVSLAYLIRQRERLTRRVEHGRRLAALGEMSAVIAHEIRNPLASLKGHAQLLAESLSSGAAQTKAERVVGEAVRIQNLVSDLLDFSGTGNLDLQPTDPAAVLHGAAQDVDTARIVERTDGAPGSWVLDAARMRQALSNVLRNAVQATPDGSPVEAAILCANGCLTFEVRDHGPGIPLGEEEKIFEPFHTRKARGTGLGLALVRRIVEQHGGSVIALNAPQGGALFRIALPRS